MEMAVLYSYIPFWIRSVTEIVLHSDPRLGPHSRAMMQVYQIKAALILERLLLSGNQIDAPTIPRRADERI